MLKPISWYEGLKNTQTRKNEGFFLVEGEKAIFQILSISPQIIKEILTPKEISNNIKQKFNCYVRFITLKQLKKICSSQNPSGPVAVVEIPKNVYSSVLPDNKGSKILILEDIQDPGNTGTLIRTAAAFDFNGVILSDKCADPFNHKVVQASAGSILSLWLRKTNKYFDLILNLQNQGYNLIAADVSGKERLNNISEKKIMLAIGNEARGLSQNLLKIANKKVVIPINSHKVQSLNAAVAGSLFMYVIYSGMNYK
jgi:TrmH family RNA methyltransferase